MDNYCVLYYDLISVLLKDKETFDPTLHDIIDVSKTSLHMQVLFFTTLRWLCYCTEKLTFVLSLLTAISPQFTSLVMSTDTQPGPACITLVRQNTTLAPKFWQFCENRWYLSWLIWRNNFNIHLAIWIKEQNYGKYYWYPINQVMCIASSISYIEFHVL